jgi:hypothetical protein
MSNCGMNDYECLYKESLSGGGMWGNAATTISGVNTLANGFMAYKNYGLAQKSFKINKNMAVQNYTNQPMSYNDNMQRRERASMVQKNMSESAMTSYLNSDNFRRRLVKEQL